MMLTTQQHGADDPSLTSNNVSQPEVISHEVATILREQERMVHFKLLRLATIYSSPQDTYIIKFDNELADTALPPPSPRLSASRTATLKELINLWWLKDKSSTKTNQHTRQTASMSAKAKFFEEQINAQKPKPVRPVLHFPLLSLLLCVPHLFPLSLCVGSLQIKKEVVWTPSQGSNGTGAHNNPGFKQQTKKKLNLGEPPEKKSFADLP
jgi:hypothetical protein